MQNEGEHAPEQHSVCFCTGTRDIAMLTLFFFPLCFANMLVQHRHAVPVVDRRGHPSFPRTGVRDVGARKQTLVLWRSSQSSQLLNHLSRLRRKTISP